MRRAIADAARLEQIVEGHVVGNPLGLDPHRARGDHRHLAASEILGRAGVIDDGLRAVVAGHLACAAALPVLELGEHDWIGDAFAQRLPAGHTGDFPQARVDLGKRGRRLRGAEHDDRACSRSGSEKEFHANHKLPFSMLWLSQGY